MLPTFANLLGLHSPPTDLTWAQISLRGLAVMLWGGVIIRVGDGRLLRHAGRHALSRLLKGLPRILVHNGKADHAAMRRTRITPEDLDENLGINGNVRNIHDGAEARLERNGEVSVVRKSP